MAYRKVMRKMCKKLKKGLGLMKRVMETCGKKMRRRTFEWKKIKTKSSISHKIGVSSQGWPIAGLRKRKACKD